MFKLVVLSSVLALAASSAIAPLGLAGVHGLGVHGLGLGVPGLGWGAGWAGPWGAGLAAPLVAPAAHLGVGGVAVAPAVGANYRGPLSLAPGQPANILAADGRPLDTLSVNLDRAAHLTARVVDGSRLHGVHVLKKRSAPLVAPAVAWSHTARVDLPGRLIAPAVAAPWGAHVAAAPWGAHVAAAPLGLGWRGVPGVGAWGHAAALGHWW